jgi:isoprenylcysteine carboxyl methyltransferase (ICMT) family protein YpbQ
MAVSETAYLGLLALAALGRFAELRYSARNQRRMAAQGAQKISEPHFPWMVALHAGVFVGGGFVVVVL